MKRSSGTNVDRPGRHAARATRSERPAQKSEPILLEAAAHSLNNILTVILMNCHLAAEQDPPQAVLADLEAIQAQVHRGAALVRHLGLLDAQRPLRYRSVDLNRLLKRLRPRLVVLLGETNLIMNFDADAGSVRADPAYLETMALELVRHAAAEAGLVTIETGRLRIDESRLAAIYEVGKGDYSLLRVNHADMRLAPERAADPFAPYFATGGLGTGLELAAVHRMVKRSGGGIRVIGWPGWGTSFEVCLPRKDRVKNHPGVTPTQPATARSR